MPLAGRSHTARGRRGLWRLMRLMGLFLSLSLNRADVGSRAWGVNIAQVFISGQGGDVTLEASANLKIEGLRLV